MLNVDCSSQKIETERWITETYIQRKTIEMLNRLTSDPPNNRREVQTKDGGRKETGIKSCSLSKSRKKFGPCSSSVQVRTFNRFPIWFLQDREGKKQGKEEKEFVLKRALKSYLIEQEVFTG